MYKFLCSFLLSIFCFALLIPSVTLAQFSDIEKDSLTYMYRHGIIDGYPDGTFGPLKTINRAELLKMIMDSSYKSTSVPAESCFPDVPKDEWYAPYVCTALDNSWIQGYDDESFKPDQAINKVEAIKIIAEVQGWNISEACSTVETTFSDIESCSWYFNYVIHAENHSFLDKGDNLDPAIDILREEVTEILFRTIIEKKLGMISTEKDSMMDRTLAAISRDFFALENDALYATYEYASEQSTYSEENPCFFGNDASDKPIYETRNTMIEKEDGTTYAVFPVLIWGSELESDACPHFCVDAWMLAKFDKNNTLVAFDWTGLTLRNKYWHNWNLLSADDNVALVEKWGSELGNSTCTKSDPYSIVLEDTRE